MPELIHLNTQPRFTKTCMECRFRIGPLVRAGEWRCGFSGYYCKAEEETDSEHACGPEKQYWMPRPEGPEPSAPRGFWSRLGDAIIERVRGRRDG